MRRDIDRHPDRIKAVLTNDGVRKEFLKGAPKNDAKAIKAFVGSNADNALKTKPKVSSSAIIPCSFARSLWWDGRWPERVVDSCPSRVALAANLELSRLLSNGRVLLCDHFVSLGTES